MCVEYFCRLIPAPEVGAQVERVALQLEIALSRLLPAFAHSAEGLSWMFCLLNAALENGGFPPCDPLSLMATGF